MSVSALANEYCLEPVKTGRLDTLQTLVFPILTLNFNVQHLNYSSCNNDLKFF